MKTLNFKKVSLIAALIVMTAISSFAQPRDFERAKQRLITMKKINLLEVLNLSEEKSDKFLTKYTASENKIMEISDKIDESTRELNNLLDGKTAKANELKQKSEAIIKLQDDLNSAMSEKFRSAQSVLSEEEFAKFVVFERSFHDKLRKHLMKKPPMGKPGNPEDEEFRRGQRRNR